MKKLAIYIHIPFCKQKCKYCDFNSFYIDDDEKVSAYINAVIKQIEYFSKEANDYIVTSVYLGGGTPSFINEKYIEKIICILKEKYQFSADVEITIEANPGTVNREKLKKYIEYGINRISFGVQTLKDNLLKEIGRCHMAREAIDCFYMAREVGFNNISLDLMFGLPNQTINDLDDSLEQFIKLNPEHISAYSLKVEEDTLFYELKKQGRLKLPKEDIEREMYYLVKNKLKDNGYNQYEISNFSKSGYESRHNMSYWERLNYLGFGISASSCFNEIRFTNTDNFYEYIKSPINNYLEKEVLTKDVISSERVILGLRMLKGVDKDIFIKEEWKKSLDKLITLGLLEINDSKVKLTDKGLDLANLVFVEFI